jgi:hypothetical protein
MRFLRIECATRHAVATEMANARIDTAMLMVWGKADPRVLKE